MSLGADDTLVNRFGLLASQLMNESVDQLDVRKKHYFQATMSPTTATAKNMADLHSVDPVAETATTTTVMPTSVHVQPVKLAATAAAVAVVPVIVAAPTNTTTTMTTTRPKKSIEEMMGLDDDMAMNDIEEKLLAQVVEATATTTTVVDSAPVDAAPVDVTAAATAAATSSAQVVVGQSLSATPLLPMTVAPLKLKKKNSTMVSNYSPSVTTMTMMSETPVHMLSSSSSAAAATSSDISELVNTVTGGGKTMAPVEQIKLQLRKQPRKISSAYAHATTALLLERAAAEIPLVGTTTTESIQHNGKMIMAHAHGGSPSKVVKKRQITPRGRSMTPTALAAFTPALPGAVLADDDMPIVVQAEPEQEHQTMVRSFAPLLFFLTLTRTFTSRRRRCRRRLTPSLMPRPWPWSRQLQANSNSSSGSPSSSQSSHPLPLSK